MSAPVMVWVVSQGADIIGVHSTEDAANAYVETHDGMFFIEAMWVDGEAEVDPRIAEHDELVAEQAEQRRYGANPREYDKYKHFDKWVDNE